jgi:radical SAM protein with 4Fe4S-binding SPASM domain
MPYIVKYLDWIRISVDAGKPETYNSVRRTREGHGWDRMVANLEALLSAPIPPNRRGLGLDIGVGFVVTPTTACEIVDFAKFFSKYPVTYCQFKPEIVNREREGGIQRDLEFWNKEVWPRLLEAKAILGDKFQLNGYKLDDLVNDPTLYGRTYKKCLGSQISPCIGADGNVYVCTNHRGYKQYSYGSLYEKSFKEIWQDIATRQKIMDLIENKEGFKNCTKLCKPHESNKMLWSLYEEYRNLPDLQKGLWLDQVEARHKDTDIKHREFI